MEGAIEGRQYSSSCLCVYASSPPASSIPMIYYAPVEATPAFEPGCGLITQRDPSWPRKWEKASDKINDFLRT